MLKRLLCGIAAIALLVLAAGCKQDAAEEPSVTDEIMEGDLEQSASSTEEMCIRDRDKVAPRQEYISEFADFNKLDTFESRVAVQPAQEG